jgi:hypothetical protein
MGLEGGGESGGVEKWSVELVRVGDHEHCMDILGCNGISSSRGNKYPRPQWSCMIYIMLYYEMVGCKFRGPLVQIRRSPISSLGATNSCTSMRPPASLPPISLLSPRTRLLTKSLPLIQCLRCFSTSPIPQAKPVDPRKQMTAQKLSDIPENLGFLGPSYPPFSRCFFPLPCLSPGFVWIRIAGYLLMASWTFD